MKKLALALSIACAGALAFADDPQWNEAVWITGIGSSATAITSLDATGGTWGGLSTDNADLTEEKALVLDLDSTEEALFSVTADTTSQTAQKLTITGVFTPTAAADLLSGADMGQSGKKAQFGFAVVSTTATSENDDATTTTTYGYYAWVGGKDGNEAINDWEKIGDCADAEAVTTVEIEASYWAGSPKVTFTIGETTATYTLTGDAATAAAANKVASIACTGSGTLSTLSGVTGIAVASIGDVKYGTVNDAITAASGQSDATVKLEVDPDGTVTIPEGSSTVKIDDNGKTATIDNKGTGTMDIAFDTGDTGSGEFTIPVKVSGGTITYTPSDTSKEVASTEVIDDGKAVKVTVQTKAEILTGVQFANKAVTKSETIQKFREFLTNNKIEAYTKASTSSDAIQTALAADGDNKLPLWQSYALGIDTTTAVKPTNVTKDTDANNITLAVPAVTPTGDYTVKLKVGDNTAVEYTSGVTTISVPTDTGKYPIVLSFE